VIGVVSAAVDGEIEVSILVKFDRRKSLVIAEGTLPCKSKRGWETSAEANNARKKNIRRMVKGEVVKTMLKNSKGQPDG
jgi:hypothetical protein